ncbi:hypothetical protein NB311A_20236 [Nitrobacter sp. Nb-311A]|nr:hypothetical protein NB311A_20236 [Nitrobacter sp. Nb-311A]
MLGAFSKINEQTGQMHEQAAITAREILATFTRTQRSHVEDLDRIELARGAPAGGETIKAARKF